MKNKKHRYKKVTLPNYPFKEERCWIQTPEKGRNHNDIYYTLDWEQTAPAGESIPYPDNRAYIIIPDGHGYAQACINELHNNDCLYDILEYTTGHNDLKTSLIRMIRTILDKGATSLSVITFTGLDTESANTLTTAHLVKEQLRMCGSVLTIAGVLAAYDAVIEAKLRIITKNALHAVDGQEYVPSSSTLWGLGATLDLELPQIWGGCIDIDTHIMDHPGMLLNEIKGTTESRISLKKGVRYVARLNRRTPDDTGKNITIHKQGAYLITGGAGGVGLESVAWLASRGAGAIIVAGRREVTPELKAGLDALTTDATRIDYVQWDITDNTKIDNIKAIISALDYPLKGIINSAVVYADVSITDYHPDQFVTDMNAKVAGSWNLHHLSLEYDLDFFILYSSFAAYAGFINHASYAAGNSFLNGLALYRAASGLPALSMNWGLWPTGDEKSLRDQQTLGFTTIEAATYFEALGKCAGGTAVTPSLLHMQWDTYARYMSVKQKNELFSGLLSPEDIEPPSSKFQNTTLITKLMSTYAAQRASILAADIQKITASILEITPADVLDIRAPLMEQGLDSIIAIKVIKKINDELGLDLSPTILYTYATIENLSAYLINEVLQLHAPPASSPSKKTENASPLANTYEPIAIIGMGCKFPGGADSPLLFWDNLITGVDAAGEMPRRWDVEHYYDADPDHQGTMYTKSGNFITDIDMFDADFFSIPKNEARMLDPQQRLLLEVSLHALEDAGLNCEKLRGSKTGVFIGITTSEYGVNTLFSDNRDTIGAYSITGSTLNAASGRLAYYYDFRGPALAVDTACSSSLTALHLAVTSLQNHESDMALAGGVNIMLNPESFIALSKLQVLSPDGKCRAFDDAANGMGRGEGCGIVILKRLTDAIRDNDTISAVIRSSAVNQDGKSIGLTAPNAAAQEAVITAALQKGGVRPEDVDYIEAHGTGTHLGDPIEVNALAKVFNDRNNDLLIGTVKSNIGHLEAASGIGGVIKTALCLRNKMLPPSLHVSRLNRHVDWDAVPVKVVTTLQKWAKTTTPRLAGVSSFGLSGTNAHILIEEYTPPHQPTPASRVPGDDYSLLTLSAKNKKALHRLLERYAQYLGNTGDAITDICYTTNISRSSFNERVVIIGKQTHEFLQKITTYLMDASYHADLYDSSIKNNTISSLLMYCNDVLPVTADIPKGLYLRSPVFREVLDKCDAVLQDITGRSLIEALFEHDTTPIPADFQTVIIVAVQYALYSLWNRCGITGDVLSGRGAGKLTAAVIAGIITLEQSLKLALVYDNKNEFTILFNQLSPAPSKSPFIINNTFIPDNDARLYHADFWYDDHDGGEYHGEISELQDRAPSICIELGITNAHMPTEIPHREDGLFIPGIQTDGDSHYHFLQSLARLYVHGLPIDWTAFHTHNHHKKVCMPHYPFFRSRYWYTGSIDEDENRNTILIPDNALGFVREHIVDGQPVMPAVGYISVFFTHGYTTLHNLEFKAPFIVDGNQGTLQFDMSRTTDNPATFSFDITSGKDSITTDHCSGFVSTSPVAPPGAGIDVDAMHASFTHEIDIQSFYDAYFRYGLNFGKGFRKIRRLWKKDDTVLAHIACDTDMNNRYFKLAPGSIDSILQTTFTFAYSDESRMADSNRFFIPISIGSITQFDTIPERILAVASIKHESSLFICTTINCYDEQGRPVLTVDDFICKEIDKRTMNKQRTSSGIDDTSLQSMLYTITRHQKALTTDHAPESPDHFIIFSDNRGMGKALERIMVKNDLRTTMLYRNADAIGNTINNTIDKQSLIHLFKDHGSLSIIYLWGLDTTGPDRLDHIILEHEQKMLAEGILSIIQALCEAKKLEHSKLRIITENGAFYNTDAPMNISQSPLWGMGATISTEYKELLQAVIDIDALDTERYAPLIFDEITYGDENRVSYEAGNRFVPRLKRAVPVKKHTLPVKTDGSYLITGGTGFLGLISAKWLLEKGAHTLILVSRSEPSAERAETIETLRAGYQATIHLLTHDISHKASVDRLIRRIEDEMPPLRGIIHSAGILDSELINNHTWNHFKNVYGAKVIGTWNLHRATLDNDLDFFISYAAFASVLSDFGQINYSAANAFLNAFTRYRNSIGKKSIGINWGLWGGDGLGYATVGTTMEKVGLHEIPSGKGGEILDLIVAAGDEIPYYINFDWDFFTRYPGARKRDGLFYDLIGTTESKAHTPGEVTGTGSSTIKKRVLEIIDENIGLDSIEVEGNEDALLFSLGFDSLMLTTLRVKINEAFDLEIPQTELLFTLDTINKLIHYIEERVPDDIPEEETAERELPVSSVSLPYSSSLETLFNKQLDLLLKQTTHNPASAETIILKQLDILNTMITNQATDHNDTPRMVINEMIHEDNGMTQQDTSGDEKPAVSPVDIVETKERVFPDTAVIADMLHNEYTKLLAGEFSFDRKALNDLFNRVTVHHSINALKELGLTLTGGMLLDVEYLTVKLKITPVYHALFTALFEILTANGILIKKEGRLQVTNTMPVSSIDTIMADGTKRYPGFKSTFDLINHCGAHLASILNGSQDYQSVLFSDGGHMLEAIYRDSPLSKMFNMLLKKGMHDLCKTSDAPLTILEIGAGTGSASSFILPVLPPDRVRYDYTDLGDYFLNEAAKKFKQYPFVRYKKLDIGTDPLAQGFKENTYDIIIASNVLHATDDITQTMEQVKKLLTPNGMIMLLEVTTQPAWITIVFGLTSGWWLFKDRELRQDSPLLTNEQWQTLLESTGFQDTSILPGSPGKNDTFSSIILSKMQPALNTEDTGVLHSLPMSSVQKRIYTLSRINDGDMAYHVTFMSLLQEPVDGASLNKALNTIIARHESLRTGLEVNEDGFFQHIYRHGSLQVEVKHANSEEEINTLIDQIKRPYDFTRPPLFRVYYIITQIKGHRILFDLHHVVFDSSSVDVLIEELSALLAHQPLPPVRAQYKEYTEHEQQYFTSEAFVTDQKYWLEKFPAPPPLLNLPLDFTRPSVQHFEGKYVKIAFSKEKTDALQHLSRTAGITLNMLLLTGLYVLLQKLTGNTSIAVGTMVPTRGEKQFRKTMGMFVGTLVMKAELDSDTGLQEMLAAVKHDFIQTYNHQNYPYEKLVDTVVKKRDISRNPLFDVMFGYENHSLKGYKTATKKSSVDLSDITFLLPDALFDLLIIGALFDEGLAIHFKYNTKLFKEETIERWAHYYQHILDQFLSSPGGLIRDITLITGQEKQDILIRFNNTHTPYPADKTIHRLFEEQAARTPDARAVIAPDKQLQASLFEQSKTTLTYAQLNEKADHIAALLTAKGVTPDTIVGIMTERSVEMIIGIMGILKAGGAYMPIDPHHPADRITYMLEDSETGFLLTHKDFGEAGQFTGEVIYLDDPAIYTQDLRNTGRVEAGPGNLAYVIYTSGSTGKPKGTMIEHRSVVNRLTWMQKYYPLTPDDVILQKTPYTFDVSVWELFWWAFEGAALSFLVPGGEKEPGLIIEEIARSTVTVMHFVPSMLAPFLEYAGGQDAIGKLRSLKQVFASGEALPAPMVNTFNTMLGKTNGTLLANLYGPTEATVDVSYFDCSTDETITSVPIGKPIDNIKLYIVNEALHLQPIGVPGELCISGVGLARGYLNRVELTNEKFISNPFDTHAPYTRLYKTGDIACWLPDGNIHYMGRMDGQVKIHGNRIETGEIENVLSGHPAITGSVILPRTIDGDTVLCAYYTAAGACDIQELKTYLAQKLPAYMIPAHFCKLDEMPVTTNGKVDRKSLPMPDALNAGADAPYTAPGTDLEARIVTAWTSILKKDSLSIHDNFFNLGGDSIKAVRLLNILNRHLDRPLTVAELYAHQTPYALAHYLESPDTDQATAGTPDTVYEDMNRLKATILATGVLRAPDTIEDIYPMSTIEKGMVFHSLKEAGKSVYHDQHVHVLDYKTFDPALYKKAFSLLVDTHEILRTAFNVKDFDQPVQIVYKAVPLAVEEYDLTGKTRSEQEAYINRYIIDRRAVPFDIERAPLWRLSIITLASDRVCLVWEFHHAILDGWSNMSIMAQLHECYLTLLENPDYRPVKPASSYKNHVAEELTHPPTDAAARFWRDDLAGYNRPDFSTLLPPADPGTDRAVYLYDLGGPLLQDVYRLCQEYAIDVKSLCFAAYLITISMLFYENDLTVGLVTHNRPLCPDADKIMGCFLNTLPVRFTIAPSVTWKRVIHEVHKKLMTLKHYERTPLFHIAQCAEVKHDKTPFFDTLFNFFKFEGVDELATHITTDISVQGYEHTNTSLDLNLNLTLDKFVIYFNYTTAMFDQKRIQTLCRYFERILKQMITTPDGRIDKKMILDREDKHLLLHTLNNTTLDKRFSSIVDIIEAQIARSPDETALIANSLYTGNRCTMTYRDLHRKVNALASLLIQHGAAPGIFVGIALPRTAEMIITMLAILRTGAAYLPLDMSYPGERLAFMLTNSGTALVVTTRDCAKSMPSPVTTITLDTIDAITAESPENEDTRILDHTPYPLPDAPAYIIYTSGSTGTPKGVMITHKNVHNFILGMTRLIDFTPDKPIVSITTISFDIFVLESLLPLTTGSPIVLADEREQRDPHLLHRLIKEEQVKIIQTTPSRMQLLFEQGNDDGDDHGLTDILVGGEAFPEALLTTLQHQTSARLFNVYGPTETTVWSTVKEVTCDTAITIGKPIANTRVYIIDANGGLLPPGIYGHLCIGGAGVAKGYYHNQPLTAERFTANPFIPGDVMYKTGDLARLLPNGNLEFGGRIDRQVKIRGHRIEPGEIEQNLRDHAGVKECAVVVHSADDATHHLCAYIVPDTTADSTGRNDARTTDITLDTWRRIWNNYYALAPEQSLFNPVGWNSSYTGEPLTQAEMLEWRNDTVTRITSRYPRDILEIGCGTGMLLFGLMDDCDSYTATDIAGESIAYITQVLSEHQMPHDHITLYQRPAHDFTGTSTGTYDCIILNSVVQYFPGPDYLAGVLEKALTALRDTGCIFIGDVRNYDLMQAFHTDLTLHRISGDTPVESVRETIKQKAEREKELLISPLFFYALQQQLSDIGHVEIRYKKSRTHNEMSRFRYDVFLYKHNSPPFTIDRSLNWETDGLSLDTLRSLISDERDALLIIDSIPNKRVFELMGKSRIIAGHDSPQSIGELMANPPAPAAEALDPDDASTIAIDGYDVQPVWAGPERDAYFSLIIRKTNDGANTGLLPSALPPTWERPADWMTRYTHTPREQSFALAGELKRYLRTKLPDYMVPAFFIPLEALPLTPNGKLDKKALTAPLDRSRPIDAGQMPATDGEKRMAAIWQDVLNIQTIGTTTDFFDIGGNSLNAINLLSRIKQEFSRDIPLSYIFDHPTIRELLVCIDHTSPTDRKPYAAIERIAPRPYYELSSAQKRIYMLHQLEEDSTAYNLPGAVEIRGPLDRDRFYQAFETITNRHEALRTTFDIVDGVPVQKVASRCPFDIDHRVITDERELPALLSGMIHPFDPARLPLFRCTLYELSPARHIFFMDMHHIITDGRSFEVMIREVIDLYDGNELTPVDVQYKDFTYWQNALCESLKMESQKAYWLDQFSGELPVLNLCTDFKRPKVQSFNGALIDFTLDAGITARIKALAAQYNVSLYMIMLGFYTILLSKYAGSDDIIVGSPSAGRNHHHLEHCIGMFVNTLAMRNRPVSDKTFAAFMQEVRQNALNAYENQDYQFDRLVDHLDITRDLSRNPLFDTMFALQTIGKETFHGARLDFVPYEWHNGISLFDLSLMCWDRGTTIEASFEYCTDLFNARTIRAMITHFKQLIITTLDNPDIPIGDISPVTPDEKRAGMAGNTGALPDEYTLQPVIDVIEAQAARTPAACALTGPSLDLTRSGVTGLTYGALFEQVVNLAATLQHNHIGPGKRVAVISRRSVEMIIALLAVQKAGAAYIPIDPDYPAERMQYIITDSDSEIILAGNVDTLKLSSLNIDRIIDIATLTGSLITYHSLPQTDTAAIDDTAYIMYTSGSTGKPKGVRVTRGNMAAYTAAFLHEFDLTGDDVVLQQASYAFDTFVEEVYPILMRGGMLLIAGKYQVLDIKELLGYLDTYKATLISCSPQLLHEINKRPPVPSIHTYISGGDVLKGEYYNTLIDHAKVYNTYGPTETTVCVTYHRCDTALSHRIPIGKPIAGYTALVVDDRGNPVPHGIPGELWVGGPGVSAGYVGKPELTKQKFIDTPHCRGKVFKTGDLVRYNTDGVLEFLGRIDMQVKIRGFRIEPGEIASELLAFPGMDNVYIHCMNADNDNYLCAYYCLKPNDENPTPADLRTFLLKELPDYMIPSYFIHLEKLPLNSRGKINTRALPMPDARITTGTAYEPPRGEREVTLEAIWKTVLNREKVGRDDNFFELGGNSLKAISLISGIDSEFDTRFPLVYFFKHPTIAATAAYLADSAVEHVDYLGDRPLLLNSERKNKIFCFPPLAAYSIYYKRLAEQLDDYAVYSFGFIKSEDRVKRYADLITEIDPDGPYIFMGYCSGANLAFEVTKELESRGKTVRDIIMFDAVRRTEKRVVYPYMLDGFSQEIKKLIESLPGSVNTSTKEELLNRSRVYYHYFQELVNTGSVDANIHQIMSEQEVSNNFGWDIATDNRYTIYQGSGVHYLMLEHEHIRINGKIVKEQILDKD